MAQGWTAASRPAAPDPEGQVQDVTRQPGQTLDLGARRRMEAGFGEDFSDVRIHTGPGAAASADRIAARAYTSGPHIVFGAGAYRPDTQDGARTLAHELAHVVQQRASGPGPGPGAGPAPQSLHADTPGDGLEAAADAVGNAAGSSGNFVLPVSLRTAGQNPPPGVQRQPAPDKPTQVLDTPLIPPDWLRRPGTGDLLVARLGNRMVALPAQGVFTLVHPPTGPTGTQTPSTTVLTVPTVAKESVKMVNAGGAGFLIDAGGEPVVVNPAAMAAMYQALGVRSLAGIIVTHLHEDHVQSLFEVVIANGVRAENLHFPAGFLTNQAAPSSLFARLIRDLGNDQRGQQLGYGTNARFGSILTPSQGNWWRTEITVGDLTIEAYGLSGAFRELEARRARGEELASARLPDGTRTAQLADTASLLVRFTHRPTGFRSVFVSDVRFTDLELLKTAMGRPVYAELFAGVRVVEGVGHHLGAIESSAEQAAFGAFIKDVQLGGRGGRVAVMAQSQETRSGRQFLNRSAIAAMNEAGIDVHVALEPRGAAVGAFSVSSEGQISYAGGGRAESFLSTSPVRAEIERLESLRTIERALTRYEKYADPAHRRSAEFRQARERLESELGVFLDQTAANVRRGPAGRAQGSVRDPSAQALALARVQATVAPVEAVVTPGYLAGIAELTRLGNFADIFHQEAEIARTTGRMSDRGIDALWNIDPESARRMLSQSGLARKEQRRVAGQLPGAPASVPVRLVAVGLLALQVAEIAAPIAESIRENRFNDHVRPALEALMWWQRAAVFPRLEAVDDNFWPFSNEWTTDPARIQTLLNDREISYLTLTSVGDENWDRFTIWASARLKNQLDWALNIDRSPAVRVASGSYLGEQKFEYYTSEVHGDTVGFTLTETWRHSDRLDLILNAAANAVVDRSDTEIARAGEAPGAGLHGTFRSMDDHSTPLFDALPRASGRWRFAPGVEPALYTTFTKRRVTGYQPNSVFYSFPAPAHLDLSDGYLLVGGADFNTFSAVVATRNDYKISNVDGFGGWRVGSLLPNTEQVLLAKQSELVKVP